jgi:hypothetical protein
MMTSASEWEAIAARCEAASGADRLLDCLLRNEGETEFPPYTASVDAILSLIESTLPGAWWSVERVGDTSSAQVGPPVADHSEASAATPALALCVAFCRAMASRSDIF